MAGPAAYLYLTSPARLRPLLGGPDVLFSSSATYPPNYGPVGSYEPDDLTTGVPAGTVLTPVTTSNTTYTTAQTIDRVEFFGKVSVGGADIKFTRCVFHGKPNDPDGNCVSLTSAAALRVVFEDCTFIPVPGAPAMNGINGHDFTLRRCEIANVVDAVDPYNTNLKDADSGVVLEACWIHDPAYYTPDSHADNQTHNDGVQAQGVHKVTMRGCSFWGYYGSVGSNPEVAGKNLMSPTPAIRTDGTTVDFFDLTALLLNSTASLGTTQQHTFTDNWVRGFVCPLNLSGAGVGVNLGTFQRNRFDGNSRVTSLGGGVTGPWTILMRGDQTIDAGEGTADQNTFLDGTPIHIARNG